MNLKDKEYEERKHFLQVYTEEKKGSLLRIKPEARRGQTYTSSGNRSAKWRCSGHRSCRTLSGKNLGDMVRKHVDTKML